MSDEFVIITEKVERFLKGKTAHEGMIRDGFRGQSAYRWAWIRTEAE